MSAGVDHRLAFDAQFRPPRFDALRLVSFSGQLRLCGTGHVERPLCGALEGLGLLDACSGSGQACSLGLDPAQVLKLVERGAGGSWMLTDRGPRMLGATDVEVTSSINIFVKDSGLVAQSAQDCGAPVPLLDIAHQRYRAAADAGLGLRDDSRVIETWK